MTSVSPAPAPGGVAPTGTVGTAAVLERLATAFGTLSRLLAGAPEALTADRYRDPELLAAWPFRDDTTSVRGVALLAESRIAREEPGLLQRDHDRLSGNAADAGRDLGADHIARELASLAAACTRALGALRSGGEGELAVTAVRTLLAEQLLPWAPEALQRVADGSKTFFYQGVAAMGLGALSQAREAFLVPPEGATRPVQRLPRLG